MKTYTSCYKCNFWVTKEKYCPNCGTANPCERGLQLVFKDSSREKMIYALLFYYMIFLLGVSIVVWVVFRNDQHKLMLYGVLFVGLWAFGIFFTGAIQQIAVISESKTAKRPSLSRTAQAITTRLSEIDKFLSQLTDIEKNITQQAYSPALDKILVVLKQSREIRYIEQKKYLIKRWELELVRWQNSLEPLIVWKNLDFKSYNERYEQLKTKEKEGKNILANWEIQNILSNTSEGKNVVQKMKNLLQILKDILIQLVQDQTIAVIKGISPIQIISNPIDISYDQLDLIDTRHSLGEFSASFDKLETEYIRLTSEIEAMEEMENMLKH